jgi:hypothetical protein
VWEHAYYIDYRGERGRYLDAFLEIINWNRIGERLSQPRGKSASEGRGFAGLGPPAEAAVPGPRA